MEFIETAGPAKYSRIHRKTFPDRGTVLCYGIDRTTRRVMVFSAKTDYGLIALMDLAEASVSGDNEVGRSATSSLAGWVSAGVPGADAQGPGDAGTTDESPTQPVHGETTRWQQPGGCCRSGGHFSAQCPPD
jgi:hypothetical protein